MQPGKRPGELSIAYPTSLTVQASYTAYGLLANASTGTSYWQAVNVDARGNVTGATYCNGVNLSKSYDAATGRLTGILSTSAPWAGRRSTCRP